MANGQGPRRGLGIAFQGRAETPDYLLTQAQNQAQRRRQTQAELQEQQQEAQESAMDDLGDMGDKIHPAYNPIKQRLKDEYFQRVKQIKDQTKPGRKFTNTEGYFKAKNDLQRAFKKLERSSENFRNYRDQVMKDDNVIGDPKVLDAFAKQDLNQVKQLTGNELGLFGDVPMRKFTVSGMASEIDEQVGRDIDYQRELGSFGQIVQKETKSPAEQRILNEVQTRWQDPEVRKYAENVLGMENVEQFGEEILGRLSGQQTQKAKNIPSYMRESYGFGEDKEREGSIWSDIAYGFDQNRDQISNAIKQGADPEQAMGQLGQQLGMPMRMENGEPTFKSSGLQSLMAQVPVWNFAGEKLHYRDPNTGEVKKVGKQDFKAMGISTEDLPDRFLQKNYPTRVVDVSVKPAVHKGGGEYEILKKGEINEKNADNIVPVQVNTFEPFDTPPEGSNVSDDELSDFNNAINSARGMGAEIYSVHPLNERASTEFYDAMIRSENLEYRGNQTGQQQYNPQGQEQQQEENERRSPENQRELSNEDLIQKYSNP